MPLTNKDMDRIESAGYRGFHESYQLMNVDGRCFFLDESGRCRIYDIRPKGCRLYPLIMGLPSRTPLIDTECLHNRYFNIDPEEVISLEELISTLEKEGKV